MMKEHWSAPRNCNKTGSIHRVLNCYYVAAFTLMAIVFVSPMAFTQENNASDDAKLSDALKTAQAYQFGDSGEAMERIRARVLEVQLNPIERNKFANTLAALLNAPESTYAFKLFVCRQLYIIGGEEQVRELIPMLADPELAPIARYALEVIPGANVNDLLWEAAATAPGPVAAGLASTLAARGGPSALSRLAILAERTEVDVVRAAIVGLGRIGGAQAESSLRIALVAAPEALHTEIYEALLACAERYHEEGDDAEAERLYLDLLAENRPIQVRVAAFDGYVALYGEQASPRVADALSTGEPVWVRVALGHIRTLGGPLSTELFAQQLPGLSPDVRALLVQALGDRGDATALPYIIDGLRDPEIGVRLATVDAVGQLGNETIVLPLLDLAMADEEEMAARARASLVSLADAGVNGALRGTYEQALPEGKALLAGILADRQVRDAVPLIVDTADAETGDVRARAYAALGKLAGADAVPQVASLFDAAEDEAERAEAAQALAALFRRIPDSEDRTDMLNALYAEAPSSVTRGGVLALYRDLGDDRMLPIVQEATASADAIVQDAAITALAGWPDAAPLDAVYAIASGTGAEAHKRAALDGYIRMLRLESGRSPEDSVAGFKRALSLAPGPDVTKAILAGLSELKSVEALDLVSGMLADEAIHTEAAVAAEKIRSKFYTATASAAAESAQQAVDGSIYSFWQTPGPQEPGQWVEINLFRSAGIKGVVLDTSRTKSGYPRGYSVYLYEAGGLPGEPVAVGAGTEGVTTVEFARPVSGQILRIEQTGTAEAPWVIHEIRVIPE